MSAVAFESFWKHTRTIAAIGRNYKAHAAEMKSATPTQPFFFLKPSSSLLPTAELKRAGKAAVLHLPRFVGSIHHELELGVVIARTAKNVSEADAMSYVAGYTLAVDVTARDLQSAAKDAGLPWTRAKGYDTFTPVGAFIPAARVANPHALRLLFQINGVTKQDGSTSEMVFSIAKLIANVSSVMTLSPCDIILTGTPAGVGPMVHGDKISAQLLDAAGKEIDSIQLNAIDDPNSKL
jgi:acylpyruvate hydrolase